MYNLKVLQHVPSRGGAARVELGVKGESAQLSIGMTKKESPRLIVVSCYVLFDLLLSIGNYVRSPWYRTYPGKGALPCTYLTMQYSML